MGFLFDLKSRLKSSGIYIAFTLVIFYFGFYAFYGERGIRKYLYLRHEVEYARTLAKQYRVKKERLACGCFRRTVWIWICWTKGRGLC